mmetsp:Transcript_76297/g.223687  ORF Transcript_76297/g.223687 Transcript_76297/m.223687 type:complete len:238 (+) Transcript_76297:114-827(+)
MLQPTSRFLCCLPLSLGVKLLLWLHLACSVYTCGVAVGNVMMNFNGVGVGTSSGMQIFSAVWSMAGIPIILVAIGGVYNGLDVAVQYYLYYLAVSAVMDTAYLVDLFLLRDACVHIELAVMARGGKAFACGMARMFSGAAAVVATIGVLYMVYIVWSYCEDRASLGSEGAIGELLGRAEKPSEWHFGHYGGNELMGKGERINLENDYYGSGHEQVYGSVEAYSGRPQMLGHTQPAYA